MHYGRWYTHGDPLAPDRRFAEQPPTSHEKINFTIAREENEYLRAVVSARIARYFQDPDAVALIDAKLWEPDEWHPNPTAAEHQVAAA
jgi:hypothetical protein